MPRQALSVEPAVTTTTEVELSARLEAQLKKKLAEYTALKAELDILDAKISGGRVPDADGEMVAVPGVKAELETLFADADEYEALETGAKVNMPIGQVGLKLITGMTAPKFNPKKALTKLYVKKGKGYELCTLKDLEKCYDPSVEKKPYLGIFLPKAGREE